ncbi:MAG: membrane dipeptidase [Acidobacteria bacterium]|nr:membrane dipeptidase [Acidobacteriota bacterium]MBI3279349.1 membrane dipeptidase [Acidobacteriota bacterium]
MMRVAALLLAATAALGQVSPRARDLHRDALVFDAHVHVVNRQLYQGGSLGTRYTDGQFDLPRAREGGLDALFFTVFITEEYYPQHFETKQTLRLIDEAYRQIEANRGLIELARDASDLERITRAGRMAAVLDIEGGFDLDGDLGVLRVLHRLGVRSLQLPAHNWANNFADSCCAPAKWNGLSEHGRAVVREMNRLGIVINVSHGSDATIEQTIDLSTDPVLATHHGLRSFNDIPRNMPDRILKKLAAKGGVIGFHIGNEFHNRRMFEWRTKHAGRPFWDTSDVARKVAALGIAEIDKLVARRFPMVGVPAPDEVKFGVDGWLAVVERATALVGEDHVMLGSDFDGGPTLPLGMRDVRDLPLLTAGMLRRGWSEQRIRKFLGVNLLRVFRRVTEKPR